MVGFQRLRDWLSLRDYEDAKRQGEKDVISRLSRGNTLSQNGDAMTDEELRAMSEAADRDMAHLEKLVGD
jgi:hypothetical protein